jgi:hypothetical protein
LIATRKYKYKKVGGIGMEQLIGTEKSNFQNFSKPEWNPQKSGMLVESPIIPKELLEVKLQDRIPNRAEMQRIAELKRIKDARLMNVIMETGIVFRTERKILEGSAARMVRHGKVGMKQNSINAGRVYK